MIKRKINLHKLIKQNSINVGIWQGLTDGDPDVIAVFRMTNGKLCFFKHREPVVLRQHTATPFNSQNTLIRKELFPLLYLPATVSFRFTDILRGLVAQPIMWLYGYHLGFIEVTVTQKRNVHNYFNDFLAKVHIFVISVKIRHNVLALQEVWD